MKMTEEQFLEESSAGIGYCLSCHAQRDCCEPDAENYECEECGKNKVMDLELMLVYGYLKLLT